MMVPENVRPAIMAPPRPLQSGSEIVIGIRPAIVQREVRAIGSRREAAASATDSVNSMPVS